MSSRAGLRKHLANATKVADTENFSSGLQPVARPVEAGGSTDVVARESAERFPV
jgi:hypothetical protein